jgi:cytochrome c oxidase subunit 2
MESFDPITPEAREIIGTFDVALVVSVAVFLLVAGVWTYVVVRFRARGAPGGEPPQVHGNRTLETTWTVASALIVGILFALSWRTMSTVLNGASATRYPIEVLGHQWWWEYRYPDATAMNGDAVVVANELHVPTDVQLEMQITGADVIHSFWVPRFGWKADAIPGKVNPYFAYLNEPGTYDGTCTEYCLTQHAWMRIRVVAQSPADFGVWLEGQRQPAVQPQSPTAQFGQQLFTSLACASCHTIQGTTAAGRIGPDLTHLASRSILGSGILDNTPDNLQRWIKDVQKVKPGVRMPSYAGLPEQDLLALVEFLQGLT